MQDCGLSQGRILVPHFSVEAMTKAWNYGQIGPRAAWRWGGVRKTTSLLVDFKMLTFEQERLKRHRMEQGIQGHAHSHKSS